MMTTIRSAIDVTKLNVSAIDNDDEETAAHFVRKKKMKHLENK